MLWVYFNFPIKYYSLKLNNISYITDGVIALKSLHTVIGAKKHWYSTEQILEYGKYNNLILKKGLLIQINKNIAINLREINRIICRVYLQPSLEYSETIRTNFRKRFHISINYKYSSVHLRVGDADNQPFKKYINQSEIQYIVDFLKIYKKERIIILSDSPLVKRKIKQQLGSNIYTDYNLPCHSRNIKCLNQSMDDIMMMRNSNYMILTRGSTFSLFGYYFSKCKSNRIMYIGHDFEHSNYYYTESAMFYDAKAIH